MRRLKPSVELEIIKALRAGESVRSLAEKYKAPVSHIYKLKNGRDTSFYKDEE
jgi:Mor family transcriptional regulator